MGDNENDEGRAEEVREEEADVGRESEREGASRDKEEKAAVKGSAGRDSERGMGAEAW